MKLGVGQSLPEVAVRGFGMDAGAAALIARMSVPPPPERVRAIDRLAHALREAGIWAKLAALHVMAAHDAQAGRLNWVGSGYALAPVGGPGFTPDRGYAGDGAASYLDTGWAPSMGAQDSLCFGIWYQTSAVSSSSIAGAAAPGGGSGVKLAPRVTSASNGFAAAANMTDWIVFGPAPADTGLFLVNRSSATGTQGYHNGVMLGSTAAPSETPTSRTLHLGRSNIDTPFYNGARMAAAVIGRSLDSVEQAALHAALAAYLTSVGAA